MVWWGEHVVPRLTDAGLSSDAVRRARDLTCAGLTGRVIEIGFGSGLNLPSLGVGIMSLDAVEPSELAWSRSAPRREAAPFEIRRIGLDGARLAAEDAVYDGALCTFSLCTIPDAAAAVAEVARVLRPGARLHVLEHGSAPDPQVQTWQRRLEPIERALAGGCHLTRDPVALLREGGFDVAVHEQGYLAPGPMRPWTYLTRATATR